MKRALKVFLKLLPLLIGGLVVWYLFANVVQWENTPVSGVLKERVLSEGTGDTSGGHIILYVDGKDVLIPAISADGAKGAEVGVTVSVERPGLKTLLSGIETTYYVLVVLATLFAFVVQGFRLSALMKTLGHPAKILTCQRAFFVGLFYSNVIPGGQIGGDPIKAWILSRSSNLPHAIAATVMDRVIGGVGVALMAMIGVALAGEAFRTEVRLLAFLLLGGIVGGFCFVFMMPGTCTKLGLDRLAKILPAKLRQSKLADAIVTFRGKRSAILQCIGLSMAAQLGLIGAVVIAGEAIKLPLAYSNYLSLVPIANAIALIPGFPGGWGVGELAFVKLFGSVGVGAAAALVLSSLPRLAFTLVSLVGLPIMLASSIRDAAREVREEV